MAKKKLQPTAPVLTRGQMSRRERERRQIRNLYSAFIGVVSLVVLIILFAVVQTFILRPNETVASVNNVNITRATYQKLRRYNAFQSEQQQALLSQTGQSSLASGAVAVASVDNETTLDEATVNQLIDSEVLRQYAKSDPAISISATKDDLKAEARKNYLPAATPPTTPAPAASPTVSGEITGTATLTPTATLTFTPGPPTQTRTPTATLPPVPGAEQTAEVIYSEVVQSLSKSTSTHPEDKICPNGCPNISEDDYLHLIVEPQFLQTKVTDKLAATKVVTEVEQIHAQHILTETEAGAKTIITMLQQHGPDAGSTFFTQLANTQSKEQLDNQKNGQPTNGGDLGWFPKENSGFVQEFVNGAWPVKAGEFTTTPVSTTFGYHIIKVLERDPKRALPADKVESAKSQAYQDWLTAKKQEARINTKVAQPTFAPTQPAITEPTQAPVVQTPAAVTTPANGTPAGTPPVATQAPAGTPSSKNPGGAPPAETATSPPK
jgi:parvulin-like peptidyl-prolyl isomerase